PRHGQDRGPQRHARQPPRPRVPRRPAPDGPSLLHDLGIDTPRAGRGADRAGAALPSPLRRLAGAAAGTAAGDGGPRSMPRTLAELDAVRRECRALVHRSASVSGLAAVVPPPGADVRGDVTLLMQVLPVINRRFGQIG